MDSHLTSPKATDTCFDGQEKIDLQFPVEPKPDIRTVGMMIIMFEDMTMNGTSSQKFIVATPKWRKIQIQLGLGDFGGKLNPASILTAIDDLVSKVEFQQLSEIGDMADVYAKVTGVDNAMKILQNLKVIAKVALKVGTDVRAVNAQTI